MAVIDGVPKSRITIKYRTEVNGKPKDKEIPFKLLMLGDLSNGNSVDRSIDLDERRIRNLDGKNLDATMKDMKMTISMTVKNQINSEKTPTIDIDLPIDSIKSFNPSVIAERVPQLKSLMILKKLIKELETTVDNNKIFRQKLGEILTNEESLSKIKTELSNIDSFMLPAHEKIDTEAVIGTLNEASNK
ncbi:MAG: type VI secretion system contractile sheath small subunit [bacterium]|nr:type VI secretion system contractile sheath small subunit [bacterium]